MSGDERRPSVDDTDADDQTADAGVGTDALADSDGSGDGPESEAETEDSADEGKRERGREGEGEGTEGGFEWTSRENLRDDTGSSGTSPAVTDVSSGSEGVDGLPRSDAVDDVRSRPDSGDDTPPHSHAVDDADKSFLARLMEAQSGLLLFAREVLTSVAAVVAVGLLLFAISGVWPPMVAVESGSMEPHMQKGDLVFITEPGRYTPDATVGGTGVVPAEVGEAVGYRTFGDYGNVVVYDDPGSVGSPIIHRAHFWVEDGENWYDRADPEFMSAGNCEQLRNCPAPHAGFVTKGDNNGRYDQANGISPPVRQTWITGVARVRIPLLGWIRLSVSTLGVDPASGPVPAVTDPVAASTYGLTDADAVSKPQVDPSEVSNPAAETLVSPNRLTDRVGSETFAAGPTRVGVV